MKYSVRNSVVYITDTVLLLLVPHRSFLVSVSCADSMWSMRPHDSFRLFWPTLHAVKRSPISLPHLAHFLVLPAAPHANQPQPQSRGIIRGLQASSAKRPHRETSHPILVPPAGPPSDTRSPCLSALLTLASCLEFPNCYGIGPFSVVRHCGMKVFALTSSPVAAFR